ncbi:MAG: cytochrome c3 family protein [Myxococcales bacterium]|nr:cytochrome c3 family protein [Myxococcales bacterium]
MRSRSQAVKLTCILGLAVLTTGAVFFEGGPDEVVYPRQTIPVYFNHDYHVRKPDEAKGITGEGLDCQFCHENVGDSETSADRDIPGHGSCDTCHDEWIGDEDEPAPTKECARCHKDLAAGTTTTAARLSVPTPNLIFPHKRHVEAEVKCTECHKNVPDKTVATRDDYPTMDRCIACHEERDAPVTCQTCHPSGVNGRLVTRYAEGELKPRRLHVAAIHDADFLHDHAVPARRGPEYCDSCHEKKDCTSCHDGVGWDARYHPGDWIGQHSLRARKDDFRCQSCHRAQTFCFNCHLASGVASGGSVAAIVQHRTVRVDPGTNAPVGPHPMTADGWLDPVSRNFHGFHAQRNIRACASCHQEQYCTTCHAVGGIGGNPHGPNPERLRGNTASKRNARACLKCHSPSDPSWR